MVGTALDKPVLVGLSGGMDSMVAAYLLRIQKRKLYAVLIAMTPENFQEDGDALFSCHQSEARIALVKKFCEHLQIPLTVVRPREEFSEYVLETWVAAKIEARRPRQCSECQQMRMATLLKMMKELKCESLATGHYAKLMRHSPGSPVSVHSSNDLEMDQSGLVAALPQEILNYLELPLSELQRKEVSKIAENFALKPLERSLSFGACLPKQPKLTEWLEKRVPESFKEPGEIMDQNESSVARHEGFHKLSYGAPFKEFKQNEKVQLVVGSHYSKNEIMVAPEDYFKDSAVFLVNCAFGEGVDFTGPLQGFIHHSDGSPDTEVLVMPRTLGAAWVTLIEGKERFLIGESLTVFRRKGRNAKVLLIGEIQRLGRQWPKNTVEIESKTGHEKVTLDKDFNF